MPTGHSHGRGLSFDDDFASSSATLKDIREHPNLTRTSMSVGLQTATSLTFEPQLPIGTPPSGQISMPRRPPLANSATSALQMMTETTNLVTLPLRMVLMVKPMKITAITTLANLTDRPLH